MKDERIEVERRRADEAEVELARLRALLEESGRSYPERTRVLAAVVERGGRVLLARRPAGKRHAGLWELPGGKFLPGESPLEAARRELAEELGVEVATAGALLWEAPDPGSPFVVEFYAVEIRGEPAALEHDALAWVLPEELPLYPLAPSDRAFAEGLRDGRVKKGDGGGREGG